MSQRSFQRRLQTFPQVNGITGAEVPHPRYPRRSSAFSHGRPVPVSEVAAGQISVVSDRSSLLIFSPAATTAGACIRPGDLVRRSIGPDTETAARTRPAGPRTGADTDATPGSR